MYIVSKSLYRTSHRTRCARVIVHAFSSAHWNGGSLCPFCPYFPKAGPCILGGWPFRVKWTFVGAAIAPRGSLWHIPF